MSDTIWMIKVNESEDGEVVSDIYAKYGWFTSEDAARDFMRENNLHTEDEARAEWKKIKENDREFKLELMRYERDLAEYTSEMDKRNAALASGVDESVLKAVPWKPTKPKIRDFEGWWYSVVSFNKNGSAA